MKEKPIFITDQDMTKLRELVKSQKESGKKDEVNLQLLEAELDRAKVVKSTKIPADVITMHSEVHLIDMETNEETTYRVVYPHEADSAKGYVSIFAPLGTALLGYSVGDVIEWKIPIGVARWKVVKITYQPEAAGDFYL